ncbi:hypothetical protein AJ79_09832 [Helicocarpus griseus UAMH5409]|uniref:Uncharacterized protein n=1 Tax=Helicocarpus griseus UAMH5409 TaxID=1447875 RepID=A0A2B7W8L4_9EURO|nr:hypothetical protein AJ79_09832 [Helicocarpus griseus UAMH5409]
MSPSAHDVVSHRDTAKTAKIGYTATVCDQCQATAPPKADKRWLPIDDPTVNVIQLPSPSDIIIISKLNPEVVNSQQHTRQNKTDHQITTLSLTILFLILLTTPRNYPAAISALTHTRTLSNLLRTSHPPNRHRNCISHPTPN